MNSSSSGTSAYARSRAGGLDGRCLATSAGALGFFLTRCFARFGSWAVRLGACSERVTATLLLSSSGAAGVTVAVPITFEADEGPFRAVAVPVA